MKEENEKLGSDLEQMVAMLEKAEIDYVQDEVYDGEYLINIIEIDDRITMNFDEEGNLKEIFRSPSF